MLEATKVEKRKIRLKLYHKRLVNNKTDNLHLASLSFNIYYKSREEKPTFLSYFCKAEKRTDI
jgi:hypothetical protein